MLDSAPYHHAGMINEYLDHTDMKLLFLPPYKNKNTPVGIIKNAYRENQESFVTNLEKFLDFDIYIFTTIIGVIPGHINIKITRSHQEIMI